MTFKDLNIGDHFKFLEQYPGVFAIKKSPDTYRSVFTHYLENKNIKVKKVIDKRRVKK